MEMTGYPQPNFRIKKNDAGREYIFDELRKKWIVLTPEEWVRQNFIQYLVQVKKYPSALIAVEKEIRLGELYKRFDILVYDKQHQPWMMIECKEMQAKLDEKVREQVLRYNISIPVTYLIITNGHSTHIWKRDKDKLTEIETIPDFG